MDGVTFVRECRVYGVTYLLGMNVKRAARSLSPKMIEAARKHLPRLYYTLSPRPTVVRCEGCGAPEQFAECDYCGRDL